MTLYTNTAWLVAHCALSALQATGTDTCTGPAPQWGQFGLSTPTIRPQPLALAWVPLPQEGGGTRVLGVGGSPAAAVDPGAPLHSRSPMATVALLRKPCFHLNLVWQQCFFPMMTRQDPGVHRAQGSAHRPQAERTVASSRGSTCSSRQALWPRQTSYDDFPHPGLRGPAPAQGLTTMTRSGLPRAASF